MSFGVDDLVAVLGFTPTDEQLQVITADLDRPVLVVAGAGSGKTTVMAARVIWAVAHDRVTPGQVLGLTFTTKAAAELSQRIRTRLARLAELDRSPRASLRVARWDEEPSSLTYHSFAHRLVSEHGLRIGVEPDARLLTAAELAHFSYQVVVRSRLDLAVVSTRPVDVAGRLMELDAALSEHSVTPEQLEADDLATISRIADGGKVTQVIARTRQTCRARIELARLVTEFRAEKQRMGVLDFADLLRFGAQLAGGQPSVRDYLRQQHRMVLLDEYQDTSHVQTQILARLFGAGHRVTAVGDPVQGIFGWRGASAESISGFPREFADEARSVATLTLSVNHRSLPAILAGANRVAEPIRQRHPASVELRSGRVGQADPASQPGAAGGQVRAALFETQREELCWLATQIASQVAAGTSPGDIAVLCRTGADAQQVGAELTRSGVPVQVASVDGLLAQPEVIELLSVLRVVADPTDNRALVRLLRGPRWRIGLRDLAVLGRRAHDLVGEPARALAADAAEVPTAGRVAATAAAAMGTDPVDLPSLAEAAADLGKADRYPFSSQARARLGEFAAELDHLRAIAELPLSDLLAQAIRVIGLDVELAMQCLRDPIGGPFAGEVTDQFIDLVARFRASGGAGGLLPFLTWVACVERLGSRIEVLVRPRSDAVQVLTVHRAKGLEWEYVYVPFLCDGVFPSRKPSPTWLTDCAQLPYGLRGDRRALPGLTDHTPAAYERFKSDGASLREYEERQLAYVGLTRARAQLVATAHWWGPSQKRPRGPSQFLLDLRRDLAEGAVSCWEPAPADDKTNPALATPATTLAQPPRGADSVGDIVVDLRCEQSNDSVAQLTAAERQLVAEWDVAFAACQLGLDPTGRSTRSPVDAREACWTTSAALSLVRDPRRHAIDLRRPMPTPPSSAARDGIAFHAWIEGYYAQGSIFDAEELDQPWPAASMGARSPGFEMLRRGFLSLEYADRIPTATEVPFTVIIGGRAISGRIDAVFPAVSPAVSPAVFPAVSPAVFPAVSPAVFPAVSPAGQRWEVVDWKTGVTGGADPLQLAIYRLAWARMIGTEPGNVTGVFAYVGSGNVVRFDQLPDVDELARQLDAAASSCARHVGGGPR